MSPEAADLLDHARACLDISERIPAAGVPSVAAREAYMAAFHAAQAYIAEHQVRTPKTHKGVGSEFGRYAHANPQLGDDMTSFLSRAHGWKERSDYRTRSPLTAEDATQALAGRRAFVARVTAALDGSGI